MYAFQKKQDESAKTTVFYEAIRGFPVGEILGFEKIKVSTGFDVQGENRSLVYNANKRLLINDKKMLQSVRGVGYKMATPQEQVSHAANRRIRGSRQFKKGVAEISNVDVTSMTDEEKRNQMHMVNHLSTLLSASRKRSLESLVQTKKAKESIEKAVVSQNEAISQVDAIQKQLNELTKKLKTSSDVK